MTTRVAIATFLIALLSLGSVLAQETPTEAPLLPEVQQDLPPGRGFIAPRQDMSHLVNIKLPPSLANLAPPIRFDWRDSGMVTSIKNQGACGSCYAFTSIACFEAKVLVDGGASFDFSENNAKECNFYNTSCSGGNFRQMAGLFSQTGVVTEACDPYVASDVSCNSACTPVKTLLGWHMISGSDIPDPLVIKTHLMVTGPVYTTMYAGNGDAWDTEYGSYNGSYCMYYAGAEPTNHAVLIVGWDDDFIHAGGTGGWIVKNSWGSGWGDGGYFYIAYASASIGQWSSFVGETQDYDANETLYYHDEGGWDSQWGYGSPTVWGMARFTPTADGYLNRIEFWTNDAASVDVFVYDDFGSAPTNLLTSELGKTFNEAGYHSVSLTSPPQVTSGDDVYAVVRISNNSYGFPLVTDNSGPTPSGYTYMSSTGSSGTWTDMGASYGNDVAIRIRTVPSLSVGIEDDDENSLPYRYNLGNNYPNPFNPTTTIEYSLEQRSHVTISVFNVIGQEVSTLTSQVQSAGPHTTGWDGTDYTGRPVASGMYFYRMTAGDFTQTRKMLLLK